MATSTTSSSQGRRRVRGGTGGSATEQSGQRGRTAGGAGRPGKSGRKSNRDRIIEASLDLFNDRGARNVTTNHIASHLGISPGNLYYHFSNREEIVRALYESGAAEVRSGLVLSESGNISAADLGRYYLTGIEVVWKYRFFFRDIDELLLRDPLLAGSFAELQAWMIDQMCEVMERLIAQGDMRAPDPIEDLQRLSENSFILWTSWIRFLAASRPSLQLRPADVVEGALHNFLTFAAYVDPSFAHDVRAALAAVVHRKQ